MNATSSGYDSRVPILIFVLYFQHITNLEMGSLSMPNEIYTPTKEEIEARVSRFSELKPMSVADELDWVGQDAMDLFYARKLMPVILDDENSWPVKIFKALALLILGLPVVIGLYGILGFFLGIAYSGY